MTELDRKRKLDVVKKSVPAEIRRVLEDTTPKVEAWEDPFVDTWDNALSHVAAELKRVESSRRRRCVVCRKALHRC